MHDIEVNLEYANNSYILKWWNNKLDNLIKQAIIEYKWYWHWNITEIILNNVEKNIIDNWKNSDISCKQYAWNNVLMYFCMARAKTLSYLNLLDEPKSKQCELCGNYFIESEYPFSIITRIGLNNLYFCPHCLENMIYPNTGNNKMKKKNIQLYLNNLSKIIKKVPNFGFGENVGDLLYFDKNTLKELFILFQNKPTTNCVIKKFGSWLNALIVSGVLENGTRRTSRGTQTLALDGHVCLSLGEKTIDDYLYTNCIKHEKEPKYPSGNYRADFLVGDIFIEYFGLVGNEDYDKKIVLKKQICKKYNINLIEIYPQDLVDAKILDKKIKSKIIKV